MLVTVFCAPRGRPETTFALEVSPELELRDFVALCELESGIPAEEIQITYVEQLLKDPTRALGNYGVKDGDVVVLRQADRRPPPTQPAFPGLPHIDFRSITVPGTSSSSNPRSGTRQPGSQPPRLQQPPQQQQPLPPHAAQSSSPMAARGSSSQGLDDPALLQQMLLSNPHELSLLKERNPPLAEALLSGDLERFTKVLLEQQQDRAKREQERIRLLTADPFDLEAQAKIEEDIRQHNVEENMTIAMEEAPESFGQVVMLYINCKVNGHPVKAFVDSGAQMTIMSQACAERCNIMRLVDRRWAGIAKGVGTQKIIGRVHLAQVQIEGDFLPCSFSILEDQPMDMLLGLDMLKRHQCSIDLKKSVLLIGTTGTETRFLSEAELPECARLAYGAEGRDDARPDEIADRELAEALQRSIQESDTADGQTTSRQPPPFTLPRTLDQMSSSTTPSQSSPASGQTHALDRSQSAPAAMEQGLREVPPPSSSTQDAALVDSALADAALADALHPTDVTTASQDVEGGEASEGAARSEEELHDPEELSPSQPMEQEEAAADNEPAKASADDPDQADSVEMDSPAAPEMEQQSDAERSSGSDNIPSLAAALMELHELLVSNNRAQNRSSSCSPSDLLGQDMELEVPESKPDAEPSDAKVPAVSGKEPSKCPNEEENSGRGATETVEEGVEPSQQSPSNSKDPTATPQECRDASESVNLQPTELSLLQPPSEVTSDPPAPPPAAEGPPHALEAPPPVLKAPPLALEAPPPAVEAPLRVLEAPPPAVEAPLPVLETPPTAIEAPPSVHAATPCAPEAPPPAPEALPPACAASAPALEAPLPVHTDPLAAHPPALEAPPPAQASPPPHSPHPAIEQFPAEHIQRIQAAGFSASEAAEALERAHGVVELALLALLARSITVPT